MLQHSQHLHLSEPMAWLTHREIRGARSAQNLEPKQTARSRSHSNKNVRGCRFIFVGCRQIIFVGCQFLLRCCQFIFVGCPFLFWCCPIAFFGRQFLLGGCQFTLGGCHFKWRCCQFIFVGCQFELRCSQFIFVGFRFLLRCCLFIFVGCQFLLRCGQFIFVGFQFMLRCCQFIFVGCQFPMRCFQFIFLFICVCRTRARRTMENYIGAVGGGKARESAQGKSLPHSPALKQQYRKHYAFSSFLGTNQMVASKVL